MMDAPHTSDERLLARQLIRRNSDVDEGHQDPLMYRQKSHKYRAVTGTAHGRDERCLRFAETRNDQGSVPAEATSAPAMTARRITGTLCHRRWMG
jgi:hypothetical protein